MMQQNVCLVLIFTIFLSSIPNLLSQQCTTHNSTNTYGWLIYNYSCPTGNFTITIDYHFMGGEVTLKCENLGIYDQDIFSNLNITNIELLNMNDCPLPHTSINSIFKMEYVRYFDFSGLGANQSKETSFGKHLFTTPGMIEKLSIRRNNFAQVEDDVLSGMYQLQRIDLSENEITEIGYIFNETNALLNIDLSKNQLKILPKSVFGNLSYLRKLYLNNNHLTSLNKEVFVGLHSLTYLQLDNNKISSIPYNTFSSLPKLISIFISNNSISYVRNGTFAFTRTLKTVDLSNNLNITIELNVFPKRLLLTNLLLHDCNLTLLPKHVIKHFKVISLKNNNIGYLQRRMFLRTGVKAFYIGQNPNLTMEDYVFSHSARLTKVNLKACGLKMIPEHTFEASTQLQNITLSQNKLISLSENLFKNLSHLNILDLGHNEIEHIPDKLFRDTVNITELYLQNNKIRVISIDMFKSLERLKILDLGYNNIFLIENHAFSQLKVLENISLSHNFITDRDVEKLKNISGHLRDIDLSSNRIRFYPNFLDEFNAPLMMLNLSSNNIEIIKMSEFVLQRIIIETTFDFSKNPVKNIIDFQNAEKLLQDLFVNGALAQFLYRNFNIILDDIKIPCDCNVYDIVKYNNGILYSTLREKLTFSQKNFNCTNFSRNVSVISLHPCDISCAVNDSMSECPQKCSCSWRPYNQSIVVDCSYRNLSHVPKLDLKKSDETQLTGTFSFNQTEVILEGNNLISGPDEQSGYVNVTILILSKNQLQNLTWIPPKIKILKIDRNQIRGLDEKVINNLQNSSTLKTLTLFSNPWTCDCSAAELQQMVMLLYPKVDRNEVICFDSKKPLVSLKDLCQISTSLIAAISTVLLFIFTLLTTLAVYYRYEKEIKIYLYSKNCCLCLVKEEELDKDKIYDAFLCYSHKDEDFIIRDLLPLLEKGPYPFKVCIHVRDWIPGEFITAQITGSVLASRRTLIVLSNNFAQSGWGLMEFRTAHSQTLADGMARVVVVLYGELNEEYLDSELKAYFKTNTYIKWGDPWFWKRLRYALPHSKKSLKAGNNAGSDEDRELRNVLLPMKKSMTSSLADYDVPIQKYRENEESR